MIIFNKYKVVDNTKFKRFLVLILFMSLILMAMTLYTFTAYSFNEHKYIEIPVKSGDTIWEIAKEYGISNSLRKDVYTIMEFNNLEDAVIYPGQLIKIPLE